MANVLPREIFAAHSHVKAVGQDGYLFSCWEDEPPRSSKSSFYFPYLKAFSQAKRGEKPCRLDNSPFVKVSKRFIKRKLVVVEIDSINDKYKVFTKRGEKIWHQVYYPLSYAKWKPESEFAKYSKK